MTKLIVTALLGCIILVSCAEERARPSTAIDTGREFIRASLDGEFERAKELIIVDTLNMQLFDSYKNYYQKLPEVQKSNYKAASYEINKLTEIDDSTTIINYSNTYMNKPMEIKVSRVNSEWGIDFKYTYSENDTIK